MKRFIRGGWACATVLLVGACNASLIPAGSNGNGDGPTWTSGDGPSFPPGTDLKGVDLLAPPPNACGDQDPGCMTTSLGPPQKQFPLQSDSPPTPGETDNGVSRDSNGYLYLAQGNSNFSFVWIANTDDWNAGTVSKLSSKDVKELARYMTVTCWSNTTGGDGQCNGATGCCARDDNDDWNYRQGHGGQSSGKHQPVQRTGNFPSRTAVDFNGDMWVANRAFSGQSSVTKIANDPSECTERNGVPGIQTSSDVDGNGIIDTDCNVNGVPDDIADVQKTPCKNGKPQEFYGVDDECILFTTNTNINDQWGRPLALAGNNTDFGPSDAWAGTFKDGKFFRVDGTTGLIKAQGQVPITQGPYGAAVDATGILWAVKLGGGLAWLDTQNPTNAGVVRNPTAFGLGGYGITLDRDQNVWMAGYPGVNAYRYAPDRSNGTQTIGQGYWTVITNPAAGSGASGNGRGIAADSRTQGSYFVWMARDAGGFVVRIPASALPKPQNDQSIDGTGFLGIHVAGSNTIGVGLDTDQNVWAVSYAGSVATRIHVDTNGDATPPDITSGSPGLSCPAGDRCVVDMNGRGTKADPYTYSDFTGFGLRNFTNPKGSYAWVQPGCGSLETHWVKVNWDATVPQNTSLVVRARTGKTPTPDSSWGNWSSSASMSPLDLSKLMPDPAPYMQVEFDFTSMDMASSPKLKDFTIVYKCGTQIG